ncbi:MAG: hypothetical protein KBD01_08440 [Acidobacteria bacterium]|nr:hypothetical protein [Acidobacteriota bacterium]
MRHKLLWIASGGAFLLALPAIVQALVNRRETEDGLPECEWPREEQFPARGQAGILRGLVRESTETEVFVR